LTCKISFFLLLVTTMYAVEFDVPLDKLFLPAGMYHFALSSSLISHVAETNATIVSHVPISKSEVGDSSKNKSSSHI